MPDLMNRDATDMETVALPGAGTFKFSRVRPEDLGATEYTVVSVIIDISSSVYEFAGELMTTLKFIIEACQKSPRAENLLLRVVSFNTELYEIHGFKELSSIDPDRDYKDFFPSGATALYDAVDTAIQATLTYAKDLYDNDMDVNGAVYIITDGEDNASVRRPRMIKKSIDQALKQEYLESLVTVLVGLSPDSSVSLYLKKMRKDAGMTQYVDVGSATPQKLARLADFVSRSIASQSQSLGTGGPSQPLTF